MNEDDLDMDLYREIVAHGRAVAACIRSLEKENSSKVVDDQPKSLESVEHDSLDTIATATSTESSKRGENVLKALERRYHLLYLRAIEIQCMFEGLVDRRSFLEAAEDFHPTPIDTSDEEPAAKLLKFNNESSFTSCKQRDDEKVNDADSEGSEEDSEGEMECLAIGGDCVDGTTIVPVKQPTPPKTPSPNESPFETPKGTVIKRVRPKDFSKFHRSNRKSKNCAIFYYKHVDTDTDQLNDESGAEKPLVSSEPSDEEVWEFTNNTSNDISPLTPDKEHHESLNHEEFNCFPLHLSPEQQQKCETSSHDINSQQQNESFASNTTKLINTKESLRELVLEAESFVRQKINDRTSKTEYFFNEIIAKSQQQKQHKQRQKKLMEKSQKDTVKISRVQEWLKRHQETSDGNVIITQPLPTTDCEASGEYTTEESGHESDTSEEITDSVATCLQGTDHLQTSTEGLGSGVESAPMYNKITMRAKTTGRRNSDRPWSVSCLSQLTRNSQQSLIETKVREASTALASFSISESALNYLTPQKYKTTSESDSKNCLKNGGPSTGNSIGSKNSLRRRRAKLRKKSYSSSNNNKRSESGSEVPSSDVSRNILRSMTKSESFSMGTSLMEDLSDAISMMTIVKDSTQMNSQAQKPESDDEHGQRMMKPDFKIGSLTNVYANPSTNLGSLAALSNYNNENNCGEQELNETGTENMSSFSEQMWDNYMEKYNSEAYSEDRDVDGARRLLEFGDDYRNFIDSQSDCCSSLSAANIDSLSPPRARKSFNGVPHQNVSLSSNDNSLNILRQRRIQELPEMERRRMSNGEDRKALMVEKLRQKSQDIEAVVPRRRSVHSNPRPVSYKSSSSDHSDNEMNEERISALKILIECKANLERTEALRMANPQLLRPEDYVSLQSFHSEVPQSNFMVKHDEIIATCRKSVECLEAFLRAGSGDPKTLKDLIASWNNLLNWSENAAIARKLQEEIILQKQSLDLIVIDNGECLDTEEAIRERIRDLNNAREDLIKHRSNMLKLNASVHSWLTRQEMSRNDETKVVEEADNDRTTQSDLQAFADDELHRHLKDEIVSLYAKWDSINDRISSRLENLTMSLVCWKQFENGLVEFQENLSKDRGALFGLKGAIEDGTPPEDLVDSVQQVSKLLSEKLENKIQQTISTNEDLMLHPEAALQFIASSNGSLSDSGISDGGFSELSERERRLIALKKIAKQLENALSPSSEVLKTITQRMEAAENELKILQNTCRELIVRTSTQLLQQQGIDIPPSLKNAQSQINVQIPIITIKGKSLKRSPPKRTAKRKSPHPSTVKPTTTTSAVAGGGLKGQSRASCDEINSKSDSDVDDVDSKHSSRWRFVKRIVKMAVPVQLAIVTLFCLACLLEPRCCDTLNNLSMSFTPQLRYVKGPPPT
ncbi:CLUMA_CG011365, isoform A [Clunio marinus]|uniref:CLUMA_CG011365, isoform A n=1 Tax=Clunio marinus TaxID=568069 RepID=A0A1J1IEL3_9DIPT|nr:CLUMA_CG011365, isoform A [Clunio marinus]